MRKHGLDRPSEPAFAFRDRARNTFYDWHTHPNHQLIFALDGATQIETGLARYLLPVGRAAWIPAGVRHRTLVSDADGTSLYFAPDSVAGGDRVRILLADPLMREMVLYAMRWPRGEGERNPLAKSFFQTLSLFCAHWLKDELPLALPSANHAGLARAMDHALDNLADVSQGDVLKTAGMSERSFRRHILAETGMTWQAWLAQARILQAMALLTQGRRVTDVAAAVGYDSLSAFAKTFSQLTGETPIAFRRRSADAIKR
ncbi:MAG TPA: helix-turn-helix transcriptional regulator [Rhizomicrobium sp.]